MKTMGAPAFKASGNCCYRHDRLDFKRGSPYDFKKNGRRQEARTMANRKQIKERVLKAAQAALQAQQDVSPLDVLVGMGMVQAAHVQKWRKGQLWCLERVIQGNLSKISFAMKCFRGFAMAKGLLPRKTAYVVRSKKGPKRELQFSKSGDSAIEAAYRTHYGSPLLSGKKREKNLKNPPEPSMSLEASL
jgi:hypothetical protein